jgi:hypothetical protein
MVKHWGVTTEMSPTTDVVEAADVRTYVLNTLDGPADIWIAVVAARFRDLGFIVDDIEADNAVAGRMSCSRRRVVRGIP